MFGTHVNPASVNPGDKIATKHATLNDGSVQVIKTRDVKRVSWCGSKPENVHLDHECYDTRNSTVIIPN